MTLQPPYEHVPAAYQLRYHLRFQTRRNRPVLKGPACATVNSSLSEICARSDYHLLGSQIRPNLLELLISLKPTDAVSHVIARLKANIARIVFAAHPEVESVIGRRNLWSSSYQVETVGQATTAAIKAYVDSQRDHHQVTMQTPRRLSLYSAPDRESYVGWRHSSHAVHRLNYHLVFSTKCSRRIIDQVATDYLAPLWLRICDEKGYDLLTLDILEDHAHCAVALAPQVAPQTAAEILMNNTCVLALRHVPGLEALCADGQLWTPGFFVRGVGNRTTAQVMSYFRARDQGLRADTGGEL